MFLWRAVDDEGEVIENRAELIPETAIEREAGLTGPLPSTPEPTSRIENGHPPPDTTTDVLPGKHKTAKILTSKWKEGADALAVRCPHYQNKTGKANPFHMANTAGKLGYAEVTDDNLGEVLNALEDYATKAESAGIPA